MNPYVDTSIIVRYLVGHPPDPARCAREIMDGRSPLIIPEVALAETGFVLESVYDVPRHVAVDHLIGLLKKTNIATAPLPKEEVIQALLLCRPSGRVSYPDALIWATARRTPGAAIYSLDERFPAEGVELRR